MNLRYPISFSKMSGSGNDFIIIDHRQAFLTGVNVGEFARVVCRRKFSVGADGLILIEKSEKADFRWQFLNGDGSIAEMCGNGARCAARFAYINKIAPAAMRFETLAGIIEAYVDSDGGDSVKVRLTPPTDIQLHRELSLDNKVTVVNFINTGVPHVVSLVDSAKAVPVIKLGRSIRYHSAFQPAGTNVNFVQILPDNALYVRTYERGVEDETLACGTGAVAAAIVAALLQRVAPPVLVITSGGEQLTIHFSLSGTSGGQGSEASDVFLEGSASLIYEGQLQVGALRNIT